MQKSGRFIAEVCLLSFLLLLFVFALANTRNLTEDGRVFALFVTLTGLPIVVGALAQTLWRARQGVPTSAGRRDLPSDEDDLLQRAAASEKDFVVPTGGGQDSRTVQRSIRFGVWFIAFCGASLGFGFYVGVPVVSGAYVLLDARKSVVAAVLTGVLTWLFLYGVFTEVFAIRLPSGFFL